MWSTIISAINKQSELKHKRRVAQEESLASGPSWRYRRRLIHGAYAMGILMILFGAATILLQSQVSVEMIIGGVALISIIVTSYTMSATYEDVRLWDPKSRSYGYHTDEELKD